MDVVSISGRVTKGKQYGRTLGFPTANIVLPCSIEPGVYAGKVFLSQTLSYTGALFVAPEGKILEAHLLDFSGDLYGKRIRVEIEERIRDTEEFSSQGALCQQIARDVARIRELKKCTQ